MKLYKFRAVDTYSLTSLSSNSLWLSDLSDFNDPFEGMYQLDKNIDQLTMKQAKSRIGWKSKEEIGEENYYRMLSSMGLEEDELTEEVLFESVARHDLKILIDVIHRSKAVCMSLQEEEKDPLYENLMWSHYADGLRGFCLVFDGELIQQNIYNSEEKAMRFIKVDYQDSPNVLKLSDFIKSRNITGITEQEYVIDVTETIATKSTSWSYENEVRLLSLEKKNVHKYSPDSLLEIVIGEKMPDDQVKLVVDTAKKANQNITIKKAYIKQDSYQIDVVHFPY